MYEQSISHFAELAREKCDVAHRSSTAFVVGAMLAGAYIGIAMILALTVGSEVTSTIRPVVMGCLFGVGLILTIFAGAELFTGYVMYLGFGLARGSITIVDALRTLMLVWIGNLGGALVLVLLYKIAGGAILSGDTSALDAYVAHKVNADLSAIVVRGILCNWLVCLAIWTAHRVQGDAAKCIIIAWVLLAFVACGFEHSVANMTALPLGLLVPSPTIHFLGAARNLIAVTVGNALGGAIPITCAYLVAAQSDTNAAKTKQDAGLLRPH
jgi:nitrite transporter NirC